MLQKRTTSTVHISQCLIHVIINPARIQSDIIMINESFLSVTICELFTQMNGDWYQKFEENYLTN